MPRSLIPAACVALIWVFAAIANLSAAPVTYVESTQGPLSTSRFSPTVLGSFDIGSNTVDAGIIDGTGMSDVFTFEVPVGMQISSVVLTDYNDPLLGVNIDRFFFGIDNGTEFVTDVNDPFTTGTEFLGGLLIGDRQNEDLLPAIGNSPSAPFNGIGAGFDGPLPAGDYTVFIQQTSGNNTQYTLAFNVSAVPEPSAFSGLALVGLVSAGVSRRRRR